MTVSAARKGTVGAAAIALCAALTTHTAIAAPSPQVPAAPTPSPQVPAPAPAPAQVAAPVTYGEPVPAAVTYAVPQVDSVAQPVYADAGPAVESVPEIQYIQGEPQIVYVDRIVDREVQVVEENGTLLLLDPSYQSKIDPLKVVDHAVGNYAAYDQPTRDTLNLTAGASVAGAVGGGLAGGAIGAVGTGVTGAVAGGLAGAAASGAAVAPLCVVGGVLFPVVGGLGCVVTAAVTGAAGGAAIGGAAGAGAGLVSGAGVGAAAGAAGAAALVPGGTHAVQNLVADTAWDTEDALRTDSGFRGLVDNKPSGLPGRIAAEQSTDTRRVDGTTLEAGAVDNEAGRHASGEEAPVVDQPAEAVEQAPRHALDEEPVTPQLPSPYQAVVDTVTNVQTDVNNTVNGAKDAFANFVTTAPQLPTLTV